MNFLAGIEKIDSVARGLFFFSYISFPKKRYDHRNYTRSQTEQMYDKSNGFLVSIDRENVGDISEAKKKEKMTEKIEKCQPRGNFT